MFRRRCSPQRSVHPPPWGAGEFLTWKGLLSGRREKRQRSLHSQAEASSEHVFDPHVWASLQKTGTEAGAGVWVESLVAGELSALLHFWYWFQTESDNIQLCTWELWYGSSSSNQTVKLKFIFHPLKAVDHLKNHTGAFIRFCPLTTDHKYLSISLTIFKAYRKFSDWFSSFLAGVGSCQHSMKIHLRR